MNREDVAMDLTVQNVEILRKAPVFQAVQVPEGWKLVPIEPTEAMCEAARCAPLPAVYLDSVSAQGRLAFAASWRAALAAAPAQGGRDE